MRNEAAPTLGPVPGIDIPDVIIVRLTESRFQPCASRHLERQIASMDWRASRKFIAVPVSAWIGSHETSSIEHIALTPAAWCDVYARGSAPMVDENSDSVFADCQQTDRDNPHLFLDNRKRCPGRASSTQPAAAPGPARRAKRLLQDLGSKREPLASVAARCAAEAGRARGRRRPRPRLQIWVMSAGPHNACT